MTKFTGSYPVLQKEEISSSIFKMTFRADDIARHAKPGQFIQLRTSPDYFPLWPRPFSIHDVDIAAGKVVIIFKIFGCGTSKMAALKAGQIVQLLGPLGNSFPPLLGDRKAILAAGGVGLPPLYFLASEGIRAGYPPGNIIFITGAKSKPDFFEEKSLYNLGVDLTVCTDDGSVGRHGTVVDSMLHRLQTHPDATVYACGPTLMLEAVDGALMRMGKRGYLSLEALMPCGYGICSGCAVKVIPPVDRGPTDDTRDYHLKRVCVEGPVFKSGEVIWR